MSLDIHTDPLSHDVEYVDVKKGAIEADVPNRVYNIWAATAWQVLMMTSWTCNIILFDTVFDIGGPMMLIYSTVIVTIGQSLLMASLAEMCSIWPYAGGQQVFTQKLAPHSARRFLSYLVGWILFLGETATAASCTMNSVQVIVGVVQITYANWEATRWLEWLIYTGLTVFALLLSLSQRHLPGLALIGGFIVIAGGIAWVISFLAMAPKHSAEFVFTEFINNSGYESRGWVGIMSFYTPMYALYGTDGILHVTEEMKNPERDAPRAMLWAMIISGTSMFISGIVMGFCAGDWEAYMQTDIPYVTWFVDIYHSTAGGITLVVIILIVINFLITVGLNTAASRLAWGMARDNALPFSSVFVRINPKVQTPVNTILLTAAAQLVIGLVVFGSNYAFQVIISICLVAIQLGYLIPTLLVVIRGRKLLPTPRAFDLGVAGWPINIFSVCWCLLVIVMLFFPLYIPVNGANIYNMNWAIVLIAGVILVVFIDWVLRARHHYYYGN